MDGFPGRVALEPLETDRVDAGAQGIGPGVRRLAVVDRVGGGDHLGLFGLATEREGEGQDEGETGEGGAHGPTVAAVGSRVQRCAHGLPRISSR
mgnify:CR=1 FL=1